MYLELNIIILNKSFIKVTYPLNGQPFNNQDKHVPLTSSCSSLESAYSSSSAGCTYNIPLSKNSVSLLILNILNVILFF